MKAVTVVFLILFSLSSFAGFFGGDENKIVATNKDKYELSVCSVDTKAKKNPAYYQLPSINTKLVCNMSSKKVRTGTFEAFYNDGWRLIQVVNVDNRLQTNTKSVPYSIIYLERRK